jgi:hypothetical protein
LNLDLSSLSEDIITIKEKIFISRAIIEYIKGAFLSLLPSSCGAMEWGKYWNNTHNDDEGQIYISYRSRWEAVTNVEADCVI